MKSFKYLAVAGLVGSSALVSAPAMAGSLTGNVGVMSQYLFRGLEQNGDAAAYGGLDYAADSGFYVGTWASTITFGGVSNSGTSAEVDLYAGFAGESAGGVGYDIGLLYYWYPEEGENPVTEPDPTFNTVEIYGSLGAGPFGLSVYYAPDTYFGAVNPDGSDAKGAYGAYVSFSTPLTEKLSFDAAVGYNGGEPNEAFAGDDSGYIEYNLGVSAALDNGFGMSFGLVMTDVEGMTAGGQTIDDDPKLVVDGSYGFDL